MQHSEFLEQLKHFVSQNSLFLIAALCWFLWEIPPEMPGFPQNAFSLSYALESFLLNGFILFSFLALLQHNFSPHGYAGSFNGELLQIFFASLVGTSLSAFLFQVYQQTTLAQWANWLGQAWIYKLELAAVVIFVLWVYVVWRKLIFFGRSLYVITIWRFFEAFLFLSLLFHALPRLYLQRQPYYEWIEQGLFILSLLLAILASFNLDWVALLRYREKWFAIFVILSLFLCLGYFFEVRYEDLNSSPFYFDLTESVFLTALLVFITVYSVFSFLTVLFNLPTSNVIERKFAELSQLNNLLTHEFRHEEQFFDKILDIAVNTFKADAAWLEIKEANKLITRNIDKSKVEGIQNALHKIGSSFEHVQRFFRKQLPLSPQEMPFASVLVVPFKRQSHLMGKLVLLGKNVSIFDNVLLPNSTLAHYAAQAALALDNLRLLAEAVDNERFQAEIAAAKKFREALMPPLQFQQGSLQVLARTYSQEIIGGDFYDYYRFSNHRLAFIMGDVAGKGTAAVFYMWQMKGIFQSLVQMNLPPEQFMAYANRALANCLPAQVFVTAVYLMVDLQKQQFCYARAGHCPPMYLRPSTGQVQLLEGQGIGLGILRTADFDKYIHSYGVSYQQGDVILLYTDGVIETRSHANGEEFGIERLQRLLQEHCRLPIEELLQVIHAHLTNFSQSKNNGDDFSLLLIKL
ncbi:MAG: PP2C family protein-serine/threonine phosphatase [Cytophagales bacterium]|nr:serine/threonine-protein phosphatase [Bernardetiaceae bacterium]MDW8210036.1 PP2C family protein-serine/threonine phosphatase [Cytophagales bacterium]